jgi:hypothetical protein
LLRVLFRMGGQQMLFHQNFAAKFLMFRKTKLCEIRKKCGNTKKIWRNFVAIFIKIFVCQLICGNQTNNKIAPTWHSCFLFFFFQQLYSAM